MYTLRIILAISIATLGTADLSFAQLPCEVTELAAADLGMFADFGFAVSVSGDLAAVGARRDDDVCPGNSSCAHGRVYVFHREAASWPQEDEIAASDGAAGDAFGGSVSMGDGLLVVGAPQYFVDAPGAVYVFRKEGASWIEEAKITASDGENGDWFGHSVSLSGDFLVVGAPMDNDACPKNPF